MKPTAEQHAFIKAQLHSVLKVRETFDELYDHILCALEEVPDHMPFNKAMQGIWEHDLGGKKGIRAMQRRCIKTAIKEFLGAYYFYFLKSLKSAYLLALIALTTGFYLLVKAGKLDLNKVPLLSILSLVTAVIILRLTKKAPSWAYPKLDFAIAYVKSYGMAIIINLPQLLWTLLSTICEYLDYNGMIRWLPRPHSGMPVTNLTVNIATAFFFVMLLHATTYYQLYKHTQPKAIAI